MLFLIASGIVSLLFGLLLLASPGFLRDLGAICNRTIFTLDQKLWPIRIFIGSVLIVVGAWKLYVILDSQLWDLWHLHVSWAVSIIFGLLFLALPLALQGFSELGNKTVFSTDELVMGARRVIGAVLIIASLYLFYSAYYIR